MKNKKIINYIFLLLLSFLISAYLISFVGNKISTYEGFEDENSFPTKYVSNTLALYIIPVIPIYLIGCIYLLKKGIGVKYLVYPTIYVTWLIILTTLGVCYNGQTFGWLLILGFPFIIGGFIISTIVGTLHEFLWSKNGTKT